VTDGYLSRDRTHIAKQQRQRRARMVRIDYMPSREALAVIQTKRGPYLPFSTNSGVIDAIVIEWAQLTGINKQTIETPKTSAKSPEFSDTNARAYNFGRASNTSHIARMRARASNFDSAGVLSCPKGPRDLRG